MPQEIRQPQLQAEALAPALVPLTSLRAGERGALHACDLYESDRELLRALGLADHAQFRLCQTGNPWIVKVQGTRIGIADAVACKILVRPEIAR